MLNKSKALHPPSASVGSFYFCPSLVQAQRGLKTKIPDAYVPGLFICSGGRIRTSDLWVMSPTSCHCSTPQSVRKDTTYNFNKQKKIFPEDWLWNQGHSGLSSRLWRKRNEFLLNLQLQDNHNNVTVVVKNKSHAKSIQSPGG